MDNARGGQDQALESDPRPSAGPRRRRVGILLAVAALVYVLDVVTKLLVVSRLTPGRPVHVIGSLLQLTYTRNSGAAFSIGWGYTAIFSLIAIGVVFVILRLATHRFGQLKKPGAVAGLFLMFYGLFRMVVETVREPDSGWLHDWPLGLTMGMVLSFVMFIPGLVLFLRSGKAATAVEAEQGPAAAEPAAAPASAPLPCCNSTRIIRPIATMTCTTTKTV